MIALSMWTKSRGLLPRGWTCLLLVLAGVPSLERWIAMRIADARVDRASPPLLAGVAHLASVGIDRHPSRWPMSTWSSPGLASWQTVGGCGAGASTGSGSAVKWVGRGVRGGLFSVESQVNYVKVPYGYNFISSTLVSYDLDPWWTLSVSVPYLYKYMNDPYQVRVDLANKGPGDVALSLSRRLGAANAWKATLSLGAPTGAHDTAFRTQPLPQDRQLGLGKPTAALIVDHVTDNLWGPLVLGGSLNWRGGENDVGSYRAPSASVYAYVGPHLGPFTPAAGVAVTGNAGNDRDLGESQALPRMSVAPSLSLEWAGDAVALLLGASMPYELLVESPTVARHNRFGAWVLAFGAAFALF